MLSLGTPFRYGCFAVLMGLWAKPFLITGLGLRTRLQAGNALLALSLPHILGLSLSGHNPKSRRLMVVPGTD